MKFCTAINCMDGRVQLPVINYLKKRFNAENVDVITAAGPDLILAEGTKPKAVEMILNHVSISIKKHNSKGIAVAGHYD